MTDLLSRLADAEVAGDTATLRDLLTDDFMLVGPRGFTLTGEQWLEQFGGPLRISSLTFGDTQTRAYGDATVVVGVQTQEASYGDQPAGGRFRITAILAGERVAGLHLSPIAG